MRRAAPQRALSAENNEALCVGARVAHARVCEAMQAGAHAALVKHMRRAAGAAVKER